MKKHLLLVLGIICSLLMPSWAFAGDDEESKVVKAADDIIKGVPDALKKGLDFSKMTPAERVDWVLTSVESKVQEDVASKFQDEIKGKLEEYAKEAIRAKAFMDVGVPQLRHAYAMGQAFDWAKIDSQIASAADTNMNKLSAGIKTAQIGWAAFQAYREGNFQGAARSIGGEITEMLAEAYIPGYGYIKVGAAMVEFLGNYVLDYATDTAVEGMMNSMYGLKSNPQALAEWLIKKSPQDIKKDINDKFNDGLAFGYVFKGQGTDAGDEAMKSKIQSTLVGLRSQLVSKMKEQERKEEQVKQDIEKYLQKYRSASDGVKAVASKVKAEADAKLAPVYDFKKRVSALRKEDVKDDLSDISSQWGKVGPDGAGNGVAYAPLNRSSIISEFQALYAEVKDAPGGGFDQAAIERMYPEVTKRREEGLKNFHAENAANCQNAIQQIRGQYEPTLGALAARAASMDHGPARDAIISQSIEINNQYQAALEPRWKACAENNRKMGLDQAALEEEIKIVQLEAQERADRLGPQLVAGMNKIIEGIRTARRERDEATTALHQEIQDKFSFPEMFHGNAYVKVSTCAGICGMSDSIKDGKLELYSPGTLHAGREDAILNLELLRKDINQISNYTSKEKAILSKYQAALIQLHGQYESLIPRDLRYMPGKSSRQEDVDYLKREDERVQKYGGSAASLETWGVLSPPLINMESIPQVTDVEPIRYFSERLKQIEDLGVERNKRFQEGLKNVQEMLIVIDFYADLDRIAATIKSLGENLEKVLGPYLGFSPVFNTKDGKRDVFLAASASDGAKQLAEIKTIWEKYKPSVERMRNNVKAYGKGLKYIGFDQSPDAAIKRLPYYEAIPERIAAAEKRMAETEVQRLATNKTTEEEIEKIKEDFKALQDKTKKMLYPQRLKNLRATLDQIFKIIGLDATRAAYKEEYTKLRDDVEEYAKKREAEDKAEIEAANRQYEAEKAAAATVEKERQEKENAERVKDTNPMLYYGYQLTNPRINTHAINNASGDIIVTRDKLVQGELQLTARLNKMDHVKTILVSVDGGRSWKGLPLSQDISYAFTPIQGVRYRPFFKVKTDDMIDVPVDLLTGDGSIIYQDANLEQDIVKAVQALANAYERSDFSGFSALISQDFLGNKSALEEGVRFDFDMFTGISLKIYINRINQVGSTYAVETKWDKAQTPRKTGQQQRTSGTTTMTFVMENDQLKIKNLRGSLIYATLSPEIAQSSGLNNTVIEDIRTAKEERNPTQPGAATTEDSGGVTSSPSTLTVKTGRIVRGSQNEPPAQGYDMSSDTATAVGSGDFSFTFIEIDADNGAGIQYTANDFNALTEAPAGGYGATTTGSGFQVNTNDVFVFRTSEGYYGKMLITANDIGCYEQGVGFTSPGGGCGAGASCGVGDPCEAVQYTFKYAVGTEAGSRNITTP